MPQKTNTSSFYRLAHIMSIQLATRIKVEHVNKNPDNE